MVGSGLRRGVVSVLVVAEFDDPVSVTVGGQGGLFIVDQDNGRVRMVQG